MKMLRCSPKPQKNKSYSCFSDGGLNTLKDAWNAKHRDSPITATDPHAIWKQLHANMPDCNDETCWVKKLGLADKLMDQFAPKAPEQWKKNPTEWLSSDEIISVMRQFERAFKNFRFIGPSPINYDTKRKNGVCVWPDLCEFSVADCIADGIDKVGVVFNTDPDTKGGEHWCLLFINIDKRFIVCVDSTGAPCGKITRRFVDTVIAQGRDLSPPIEFRFEQNLTRHQTGGTECGVYTLFFCIQLLRDKIDVEGLQSHRVSDAEVEKYRKIYFN